MRCKTTVFSTHAITRMFERSLSKESVMNVIHTGETISNYPEDKPYPSRLLLGYESDLPIHVVVARNNEHYDCMVITAYRPSPTLWESDFKRRKS
jgi:hypothetical protein